MRRHPMASRSWIRPLVARGPRLQQKPATGRRPRLEVLEQRMLLSMWSVIDNSDDPLDKGSLRYAIDNAPGGTTINFAPDVIGPITLTHGALKISTDLDIEGPGAGNLTIDGNKASTVFQISRGVTVTIAGVTVADGSAALSGGGIDNSGALTVSSSIVSNNSAANDGGGIFNDGTLTVSSSTLSNNSSRKADGGGLFNSGTLTLTNSTVAGNSAGRGGGLFSDGALTLTNSTLASNSASDNGG